MQWYENLKIIRKQKGLTQTQLAELLGLQRCTIAGWEIGRREPTGNTFKKICKVLNVPMDVFVDTETPRETVNNLLIRIEKAFTSDEMSNDYKDKVFKQILDIYLSSRKLQEVKR